MAMVGGGAAKGFHLPLGAAVFRILMTTKWLNQIRVLTKHNRSADQPVQDCSALAGLGNARKAQGKRAVG